jgi:hypothetical protein
MNMAGYEKIKAMAKERRCTILDLLVLARQNDPFFAGSETDWAMAMWFTGLWNDFGFTTGIHLRRVHYQLVSQVDARKHNGLPYENTELDWDYLGKASKYARTLKLVDPTAFVDRRNPNPHVFLTAGETTDPGWDHSFPEWNLPRIDSDLTWNMDWFLPDFHVAGYDRADLLQPYHVEIWCEKSTMDDILIPLCRQHNTNLVTGIGYMSITSVLDLLQRVKDIGRPCRVLYVSDFDPAGDSMPVAVARQIEFWIQEHPMADIKLNPIILTADQVSKYKLPRIPIKETDRRKGNFEATYGTGAVELDALEALHPGVFRQIVNEAILQFVDQKLGRKLCQARDEAEEVLQVEFDDRIAPYENDLGEIENAVRDVVKNYQTRLKELDDEMQADLEPYRERMESLRQAVQDELDVIDPDLPDLPEPETPEEDDEWMFDSSRDYLDQLATYKRRGVSECQEAG